MHMQSKNYHYSVEKTTDEIYEILVNAHLNPDEDLIEIMEEGIEVDDVEANSSGEEELIISNFLNLDASSFIDNLGEIIEDRIQKRKYKMFK